MSDNQLLDLVQQSFRVTIGATASFLETLQDSQKREEALSEFRTQLTNRTQEWAEKGKVTEEEARRTIEQFMGRMNQKAPARDSPGDTVTVNTSVTEVSDSSTESELKELTEQIVALRNELEQLKNKPK